LWFEQLALLNELQVDLVALLSTSLASAQHKQVGKIKLVDGHNVDIVVYVIDNIPAGSSQQVDGLYRTLESYHNLACRDLKIAQVVDFELFYFVDLQRVE
jgi:hypothetical protein